jgi:hypothetical protein
MRVLWLAVVALALVPAVASAQGLGDTAAREKQKRAAANKDAPKKVFTNEDLPVGGESASPAAAGAGTDAKGAGTATGKGTGAAAGSSTDAKTESVDPLERERQERQRLETDWRVRFAQARERLAVAEENSWQEVVRTDFYQGVPVQMKVKEKVETPELVAARKAMADLEEEFRRTGLPPGWARER